jgi:hypothetical protein
VIGAINNIFAPPGRLNSNSVATPGFNPAADQQTQAGVVDTVSNGATQIVAASDDSGTSVAAVTNDTTTRQLDQPTSTPADLSDFYG